MLAKILGSPISPAVSVGKTCLWRSGFSAAITVWILLVVMAGFGLFGVVGWQRGWPEWILFVALAPVFLLQYLCSIRAWRVVRVLRRTRRRVG